MPTWNIGRFTSRVSCNQPGKMCVFCISIYKLWLHVNWWPGFWIVSLPRGLLKVILQAQPFSSLPKHRITNGHGLCQRSFTGVNLGSAKNFIYMRTYTSIYMGIQMHMCIDIYIYVDVCPCIYIYIFNTVHQSSFRSRSQTPGTAANTFTSI